MSKPEMPAHERGFLILQQIVQKRGEAANQAVLALLRDKTGYNTLESFHAGLCSDTDKRDFYAACLKLPEMRLVKPADVGAATPEALFQELCKTLREHGDTKVHQRIAAHLRAVTKGTKVALPLYHKATDIADADKVAFYSECIKALTTKDFSILQGQPGAGDRVSDPETAPAAAPRAAAMAVEPLDPTVDPAEAALKAALTAIQKSKDAAAGKVDEATVRAIIAEELRKSTPGPDVFKKLLSDAMNNGGFPEGRVQSIVDAALTSYKAAAPSFDVDTVVKPRIDTLLSSTVSDLLKRPVTIGSSSGAPKRSDEGPLASRVPKKDPTYVLNKEMRELLRFIYERSQAGPRNVIVVGPHGCGKCLAKGTQVLMFDGRTKKVEDIVVGDMVMGPDSTARTVESLAGGTENMWRVVPRKGEPYVVNESHILSLRHCSTKKVVNISVADYLKSSKEFKVRHQGWRSGFERPESPVEVDPYFLGVWLGDGDTNTLRIHKPDAEIRKAVTEVAAAAGCRVTVMSPVGKCPSYAVVAKRRGQFNPVLGAMQGLSVFNNKHVPWSYKGNSQRVRLQVLAGLLDTDGHLHGNTYDYISKSEQLANDVVWLARSVGLAAYISPCTKSCQGGFTGSYHRVSISGHTDRIPCRIARKQASPRRQRKDALAVGIRLEPVGYGEYFGFTLSGPDRLFLLGDFTVTHNTTMADIFAAEYGKPLLKMSCPNIREPRDWFGYKYTVDGHVLWHRSQFDRCVSEGDHVIVLDELPRTTDQIRNVLFPLLDHSRETWLEERGDYIKVGPKTVFFVTANIGAAYTGCSVLDPALDDRLSTRIEVDYLPKHEEAKVLMARTDLSFGGKGMGITKEVAMSLAELAADVRAKAIGFGATLSRTISTRQLVDAAEHFKALGVNGLTHSILTHFSADGGESSERAQVAQMIQLKFPRS